MKQQQPINFILLATLITLAPQASGEEMIHTTADTLLYRIQVEDFMHDYYWELASGESAGIANFWAEDAVFDVNGNIFTGLDAIRGTYAEGLGPGGKLVFQMDNPRIHIDGESATVDLFYTGILNTDPTEAPKLYEQGHDHVELTRIDGQWKIQSRILRSFSLDQSYEE